MPNNNVDHIDINSLSDTPLNQIKPVDDLPTDGTVSPPSGDQDISTAPLQISSNRRISLKTLAQYFDHILSQNNTLRNLKFQVEDGESGNTEVDIDTAFNKLISEISNGEISNISQILGDPKMTSSIWLFLVKTLYDLSKSQLDSFKSYTGFPTDLPNPSSLGIQKDISSILIGLDKFIAGEDNLEDWGITYTISDMFPLIVNKLWPLDNKNDNLELPNLWGNITSIAERIYYLFKWTLSSEDPTLQEIMKRPWETGNKTLYQRIVDLENAVGSGQGNDLTTRVSNLENKLLLLYKNSLAKRKEVVVDPTLSSLTIKGGTDYFYISIYDPINGANLINSISMPAELVIDFNNFLYESSLDSEDNPNISTLDSDNITPLDSNKATVSFEINHIIPYITHSNVNVNTGTVNRSKIPLNKSSLTNLVSNVSQSTELPDKPFEPGGGLVVVPTQRGNNVNYILGNGLGDITLTLDNKPHNLRVLIHEPIVNGGINPGQSISPSYENTLFGNLDNDYTDQDILNGMGYFKLEFIYNPPKSINITPGGFEGDYYTYPTLEVNVYIKLSFNSPS